MKILVMSFGSDAGGIEKSLAEFLRYLAEKDVSVDLYLWRKPGVLHGQIAEHANEISYRAYPGSLGDCLRAGRPLADALWYAKFRIYRLFGHEVKAFRSFPGEYDIAISYCQNGYSPHYVIDKVKAGKKYLWYHHGDYGGIGRKKRIDGEYFAKYDKVIAVSRACEQMLLGHFPHLDGKTTVIHNLINENEIIEKAALPMDEPWLAGLDGCKIVTVGRVSPEKGQVMAIETARVLKRRGFAFQWIFVGDGPDFDKCQRLAERLGVKEQCHFIGVKTNPYPYMKLADVYVQPSVFEAEGITVREALTLKKFVVASDISAFRETLHQGDYGILSELTAEAFLERIIRYSDSDQQEHILRCLDDRQLDKQESKKEIDCLLGL